MYEDMMNEVKKVVSKAVRENDENGFAGLKDCANRMFTLVEGLDIYSKEVEGGRCMRGSDGKLCFCEKEGGKVC